MDPTTKSWSGSCEARTLLLLYRTTICWHRGTYHINIHQTLATSVASDYRLKNCTPTTVPWRKCILAIRSVILLQCSDCVQCHWLNPQKNEAGSTRYISYKASTESEPDAWITGEAAGDVGSFCEFFSFFYSFVHNLLLIYSADALTL